MHYINRTTVAAAFVIAALLFTTLALTALPANAANPKVEGTYAFTGAGGCLQSQSGFNANFTPVNPATGNVALAQTVEGTITFNPDGTGSRSGIVMTVTEPPSTLPQVNVGSFTGAFNYTVDGAGNIALQTSGPTTGTFTQGPRTGQTYSVDEIELTGHAGKGGQTVTFGTTVAGVETITFSNGDEFDRVCNRSRVATQME